MSEVDSINEQKTQIKLNEIQKEAEIFEFSFLSDGATNLRNLFLNILVNEIYTRCCSITSGPTRQFIRWWENMEHLYVIYFWSIWKYWSCWENHRYCHVWWSFKCSTWRLILKTNNSKLTIKRRVKQNVSLFFNYVSKITTANQIITAHKAIYNIFGFGIYHKPIPVSNKTSWII